jgi:sterol desaturase/sphingolipid hydroxylase (fatty acid hydroxylase superfamily)
MFGGWLLFRAGWLRVEGDDRAGRTVVDALLLLAAMDFAMYVTHRLAHLPVPFRYVHRVHHLYERVRPLTLFVLHPVEALAFGGLWIAILLCRSFSLSGMLLYLTLNTGFGVVGHLGVEPLRGRLGSSIARVIGTSSFHARHHHEPGANFGFYTTTWDRLFGTIPGALDGPSRRSGRPVDIPPFRSETTPVDSPAQGSRR